MSAVSFDTQALVSKRRAAGVPSEQAEAVLRVIVKSHAALVTRDYLDAKLEKELSTIRADIAVTQWMIGALFAVAIANFAKQFF